MTVELTFTLSPEVANAAAAAIDMAHGIMAKEYATDPVRADTMGLALTGTSVADHLARIATARDILTGRVRDHYAGGAESLYFDAGPEPA